jgi:23S rRNA pseudouridine1911/1915/1917 synthase
MIVEGREFTFTVDNPGVRIDAFLSNEIADLSRSFIQKLIEDESILVNDKATKSNYKIRLNDNIYVCIPEPKEVEIVPENIPLDIVYEDDDIIIINKPKGMVVHPAAGHLSGTLVNALMYHCKDNLSGINGELRPGIVHRIDRDTTGLIVACKNDIAHKFIAEQLAVHSITRKYQAIVYGNIKEDTGTVDAPIYRHPQDRKRMAVVKNGKEAVTHYKVIERFGDYTHIECQLETGRTHQIRVHMSYIKHPLLGDEVYGNPNKKFKLEGQCLHAKTLGFIHPNTKEYIEFDSELPEYFNKLILRLRNGI